MSPAATNRPWTIGNVTALVEAAFRQLAHRRFEIGEAEDDHHLDRIDITAAWRHRRRSGASMRTWYLRAPGDRMGRRKIGILDSPVGRTTRKGREGASKTAP